MLSPDDFPHQVYPDDSAQRRNPGADSQCRRNPLCVRGLRHRGLGGPCRLSGEPGVLPKRPSGKQKLKGRKPGSRSGPSGRSGRRKPKHDVEVDDEEEGEEEEEEETPYEGGGGGSSRAAGGDGQRARPISTRQIKKTTIPGRVGHAIVGRTIEVFWQADGWQEGRVLSYNPATGKHTVEYTHQGAIEQLTLAKEQWRQDEPETEYDSSEEDEEGEEGEDRERMNIWWLTSGTLKGGSGPSSPPTAPSTQAAEKSRDGGADVAACKAGLAEVDTRSIALRASKDCSKHPD